MLPSQMVNLSLRGGLDRKTDGRLVIPSKLTQADDVEFVDHDTVVTRAGVNVLNFPTGNGLAYRMFEHGGVAHVEHLSGLVSKVNNAPNPSYFGGNALSYEPNTFARFGTLSSRVQSLVSKTTAPGAGTPLYDRNYDVAVGNSNYCVMWEEAGYTGRMAVKWSIRSLTDDSEVMSGIFSGVGAGTDVYVKPRVTFDAANGVFGLWVAHFLSGGVTYTVEAGTVAEAGGAFSGVTSVIVLPAGGAVEGALGLEALFDVYFHPTQKVYGVAARQTDAAGTVHMALRDQGFGLVLANTNGAPAVKPVSMTVHVTWDGSDLVVHAIFGTGANIKGYRLRTATGVQSAEVTITTVAGTLFGRCAVTDLSSGNILICADNFTATSATFATTYYLSCTTTHTGASRTAVGTNCFISGRIFRTRDRNYIPVTFTSTQYQSVTLVLDLDNAARNFGITTVAQPLFVARLDWGETANPSPLAADSAHRVPATSDLLVTYLKYETNTRLAGVVNITPAAIARFAMEGLDQLGSAKLNGLTYLAGALPQIVDGNRIVEEGFHWAPEVLGTVTNGLVVVPPVATGTGVYDFPGIGTYVVAFTETWQDAQGNWHESGVSFLCSVTTTAGNLAINPTVVRPPSLKRDQSLLAAGGKAGLTMYRTKMSSTDTTLYLAHSNELAAGTGYINDTDLGFGEPLYTEGGVLGNTPAPACRQIASYAGRLVLIGCGDGSKLYFSKVTDKGFAAEFVSDENAFQRTIPPAAGRGVGGAEMSGKFVVVAEEQIGIVFGPGPNDNVTAGEFTEFEPAAMDIGAQWRSPKSVVLAAEGVWFHSKYGLRLFGGQSIALDNQGRPVGSAIDDLVDPYVAVVALHGGTNQQTRFLNTFRSYMFVWDQVWGQFTRFTGHSSYDSCLVGGDYYLLTADGGDAVVRKRDASLNVDYYQAGVPQAYVGDVTIENIQFGGIQGFQRVRNVLVLGRVKTLPATPQFELWVTYDNADAPVAAEVVAAPTAMSNKLIQFEHQFFTQKCSTMKLQIKFSDTSQATPVRLTDLALSVGVKQGPWKSAEVK